MRTVVVVVAVLAAAAAPPLVAQVAPALSTDRPDQTEAPFAIPQGFVQFEVGGLHEVGGGTEGRLTGVGSALARIGLFSPVELRIGFLGWQRSTDDSTAARTGFGDVSAGIKVALHEGTGLVPSAAVIASLLVPIGNRDFRAAGVDPVVRVALAHTLGAGFSLGYNLGAAWITETDGTGNESLRTEGLYTLVLGRAIGSRVGVFVEAFGTLAPAADRASRHALDGGVTFAALPNLQLDATVGHGLHGAAADWFVGLGLSARVPR